MLLSSVTGRGHPGNVGKKSIVSVLVSATSRAMSDNSPQHWWQTVPGILTGLAGLLTAVGGFVLVLDQVGWLETETVPPREALPPRVESGEAPDIAREEPGSDTVGSTPLPSAEAIALKRTRFRLPEDGQRMNNARWGPFCCTGNIVAVHSAEGDLFGYIYFYTWEGQAYNIGGGSIVPDFTVQVSGAQDLSDLDSEQIVREIAFRARNLSLRSGWERAGSLRYRVTVIDAPTVSYQSQPYFEMGKIKVRVDVELATATPLPDTRMAPPPPPPTSNCQEITFMDSSKLPPVLRKERICTTD